MTLFYRITFTYILAVILLFFSTICVADNSPYTDNFVLSDGTEIGYNVYPANGNMLFLWLYSEAGPQAVENRIAQQLAKLGIETWRLDLFEAHFLPVATSSMDRIPANDISELITHARKKTNKRIIPVTTGRGSLPVLRGIRHWQQQALLNNDSMQPLAGAILMSPKFYLETPDPGVEGQLHPVVSLSNLPLFIIQPDKSPWFWKLDKTIPALEQHGSDVFLQPVHDVRDRYYFRPDATDTELALAEKLPVMLSQAARYLDKFPLKTRTLPTQQETSSEIIPGKKDRKLRKFKGNPVPPDLTLNTLKGPQTRLTDYLGKVVLVNFWASWCPPCVHEMPSMQRLQNHFKDKFIILGVNMAEDKTVINHFLKTKINVQFPILLDSDGAALKRWQVFAFPTSYIIDKSGNIRYALFGSIEWDKPEIIKLLQQLINESEK